MSDPQTRSPGALLRSAKALWRGRAQRLGRAVGPRGGPRRRHVRFADDTDGPPEGPYPCVSTGSCMGIAQRRRNQRNSPVKTLPTPRVTLSTVPRIALARVPIHPADTRRAVQRRRLPVQRHSPEVGALDAPETAMPRISTAPSRSSENDPSTERLDCPTVNCPARSGPVMGPTASCPPPAFRCA